MLGFFRENFRRPLSLSAKVLIYAAMFCFIIAGVYSWRTWGGYASTVAGTQRDTLNLTRSLAQQAQNTIQSADVMLMCLKENVEAGNLDRPRLQSFMTLQRTRLKLIQRIFVVDDRGRIIVSTLDPTAQSFNLGDRDYFIYHQGHLTDDLRITGPVQSKIDKSWIIVVSRRINHPDGSFAGVVAATISTAFFQNLYDTVDVGEDGVILLSTADGVVIVRKPFNPANVGRRFTPPSWLPQPLPASSSATFNDVSKIDGATRIGSYYSLEGYPLFVMVARAKKEALANWREEAWTHLVVAVFLTIMVGYLGKKLASQILAAQKAERLYRLLADNSTDAIICWRLDGTRNYVSPSFLALTGWNLKDLPGDFWKSFVHPDDHAMVKAAIDKLLSGELQASFIYRQSCRDGSYIWIEAGVRMFPIEADGTMGLAANLRDISARKNAEDELATANRELVAMTVTDMLTGIANRRKFEEVIEAEWNRARRDEIPLSLLMLDIDHFKKYNDTYGHQQGDTCLRLIARSIAETLNRSGDLVARYGGEEFAVVLPGASPEAALIIGERIRLAVLALGLEHTGNSSGIVTLSGGIATLVPSPDSNSSTLIRFADEALYKAKELGRNRMMLMNAAKQVQNAA